MDPTAPLPHFHPWIIHHLYQVITHLTLQACHGWTLIATGTTTVHVSVHQMNTKHSQGRLCRHLLPSSQRWTENRNFKIQRFERIRTIPSAAFSFSSYCQWLSDSWARRSWSRRSSPPLPTWHEREFCSPVCSHLLMKVMLEIRGQFLEHDSTSIKTDNHVIQ